jgi:hypothetical protein
MKVSKFSEQQIAVLLKQVDDGTKLRFKPLHPDASPQAH